MAREKPLDSAVVQAWPAAWARDHHLTGIGVDISTVFIGSARARTAELGVADRVSFVHGDASGYVASQPVSIASCIGATWIGGGGRGHGRHAPAQSRPWRHHADRRGLLAPRPPDQATVEGCGATARMRGCRYRN